MANLIAQIEALGAELRGESQTKIHTVKLKESNGKVWEWSTFHETALDGYKMGDVIEIVPELKWKEGRKNPYRNIGSVVGKRDASEINTLDVFAQQPGQPAEALGSSNGTHDQGKIIERRSIERQTSVKLMAEIYKAGCGVGDLAMVAEAIVKAAETIEVWLARQRPLATVKVPDPENYGKFIDAPVNGASSRESQEQGPVKMETIGDLFTAVKAKFGKTPVDIFDILSFDNKEQLLEKMTPLTAWEGLLSVWEGPPTDASSDQN